MRLWLDLLFRPALGARRVERTRLRGYGALVTLGVLWAALMTLLALGGHRPSMARGLPVEAGRYYLTAALYIGPLAVGLGDLFARVAALVSGADARACAALRIGYGAVVGTAFVLPELVAYPTLGYAALGAMVRVTAPLTLVWLLVSCTAALRELGVSGARALGATIAAVVVQALPAVFLIR